MTLRHGMPEAGRASGHTCDQRADVCTEEAGAQLPSAGNGRLLQ
eukprot:gene30341-19716_t